MSRLYTAIQYLIIGLCVIGCAPSNITVSGEIDHVIKVDASSLDKYFRAKCATTLGLPVTSSAVEVCADNLVADFINSVGGGL